MFKFLEGLDNDIQKSLLGQLRDVWTHTSTALEGNTLTQGDTHFILEEGLTVSGKPLKDHQEVVGHAKAIALLYAMLGRDITENDSFELHKAIQVEHISDIYKPYGAWKVEPNGTYGIDEKTNKPVYIEYAQPKNVPALMEEVILRLNKYRTEDLTIKSGPKAYAQIHSGIAHIHPFWDGNGRIARLMANLPLLNAGLPPMVIRKEKRRDYIRELFDYQSVVGEIDKQTGVWPNRDKLTGFIEFCESEYKTTQQLVSDAFKLQAKRRS